MAGIIGGGAHVHAGGAGETFHQFEPCVGGADATAVEQQVGVGRQCLAPLAEARRQARESVVADQGIAELKLA